MRKREGDKETAILEAATKEFAAHGFHGAKISKIAESAGVATGSVYLYYTDKEDIILKIFDRLWKHLAAEIKRVTKERNFSPAEKFDFVVDSLFETFTSKPTLAIVFVNEQNRLIDGGKGDVARVYEEYLDIAEAVIQEGIDSGEFRNTLDLKILRHFVTGGLRTLLRLWARDPEHFPLDRIRESVKLFIKHGILDYDEEMAMQKRGRSED